MMIVLQRGALITRLPVVDLCVKTNAGFLHRLFDAFGYSLEGLSPRHRFWCELDVAVQNGTDFASDSLSSIAHAHARLFASSALCHDARSGSAAGMSGSKSFLVVLREFVAMSHLVSLEFG